MESFSGKLRDECLNGELFLSLAEARYVVDGWRLDYNHYGPYGLLGWQTLAAYACQCPRRKLWRLCVPPCSVAPHAPEQTVQALP